MHPEPHPPPLAMDGLLAALRAAAEPTRLRLMAVLAHGELTVSELVRILGQSQPRISRHLKLLTDAGLLTRHREGSWVFHALATDGPGAAVVGHLGALLPDDGADDRVLKRDLERLAAVRRARADKAAGYFRMNAAQWDRLRSLHADDREVEKVVGRLLPKTGIGRLLDLGTGTGRMLELLAPRADRGEGIDLSPEMLTVARANLERARVGNCRLRQGNLYELPIADETTDVVTIHQVLHYLDDPRAAIAEAARVLVPGGLLLVADFEPHTVEALRDEHQHRRLGFAEGDMRRWFSAAGLKPRDTVAIAGDPLTVLVWLAAKPGKAARR